MVDIDVDRLPGEWTQGYDQQLETAVRTLLDGLVAQPAGAGSD
jgi:hypothetical protein